MLTALIGIVALRAYTHFASAEVFGAANLILGVLGLGFQALVQPVVSTQLRYHAEAQRAGRGDGFTVQILGWALLAATLVAALFLSSFPLWSAGEKGGLGVALALAAVFWAFVELRGACSTRVSTRSNEWRASCGCAWRRPVSLRW